MRRTVLKGMAVALVASVTIGLGGIAHAEDAAEFYKGKAIKWIVPYKPGGGYDEYSRMIAPYMEKYTGARVDIVNMPGSGGMKGAVEIFNSPADGLHIGIINGSAMITNELAGIEGANYKVADYNFLGRIVADQRVLVTGTNSGIDSFEDMMTDGSTAVVGATGLGGSTYVDAVIVGEAFGIDQKVVHGFNSSSDIRTAMLRGDVHAMWGSLGSAAKGVTAGDHKIILHGEREPSGMLAGIPSVFDMAAEAEDADRKLAILDAWDGLSAVGRPVAAPPGVPADRLAFLRDAFAQAMQDPEFVAKTEETGRDIAFADGDRTGKIAKASTDLDETNRVLFVRAIKGEL
ncbi:Bug family tripartite tricarboxylate transporter substrate binding protein [Roseibium marinum]|uniref:Tripartite-type tricarboxylate transporter receptor subunit TctC n=1 Tax=Roseibium marinum TaxID=281252 RepID=A0A2S3V3Z4_9HYPH|nr:tripartite tricarboxylate transporter substrate-binding protein [Roseibium marinum]POF34493.1 tripartite-type tricarboxylate transporter receptor subunit TctC [Roseibium marinum]